MDSIKPGFRKRLLQFVKSLKPLFKTRIICDVGTSTSRDVGEIWSPAMIRVEGDIAELRFPVLNVTQRNTLIDILDRHFPKRYCWDGSNNRPVLLNGTYVPIDWKLIDREPIIPVALLTIICSYSSPATNAKIAYVTELPELAYVNTNKSSASADPVDVMYEIDGRSRDPAIDLCATGGITANIRNRFCNIKYDSVENLYKNRSRVEIMTFPEITDHFEKQLRKQIESDESLTNIDVLVSEFEIKGDIVITGQTSISVAPKIDKILCGNPHDAFPGTIPEICNRLSINSVEIYDIRKELVLDKFTHITDLVSGGPRFYSKHEKNIEIKIPATVKSLSLFGNVIPVCSPGHIFETLTFHENRETLPDVKHLTMYIESNITDFSTIREIKSLRKLTLVPQFPLGHDEQFAANLGDINIEELHIMHWNSKANMELKIGKNRIKKLTFSYNKGLPDLRMFPELTDLTVTGIPATQKLPDLDTLTIRDFKPTTIRNPFNCRVLASIFPVKLHPDCNIGLYSSLVN